MQCQKRNVTSATINGKILSLENAKTPDELNKGLMFRKHLPENNGMLFSYNHMDNHSFWMKNTLIPLDMIFVNHEDTVVGVINNAAPQTLISRQIGTPSCYVIETNGGWAQKNEVKEGTKIFFK